MPSLVPVEKTAESAAQESLQRYSPTRFLMKTYQLVDDPTVDHLISWNKDGTGFIVSCAAEFARDLLPKCFKHNNFSSFVRQLYGYGFKKVGKDKLEFAHDYFRRGEIGLLCQIQRRKISRASSVTAANPTSAVQASSGNSAEGQVLSSNSLLMWTSSGPTVPPAYNSTAYLEEENAWLRKENAALKLELERWRGFCSNVANMIASFAASDSYTAVPVEFMQSEDFRMEKAGVEEEKSQGPQFFGLATGAKPMDEQVEKSGAKEDVIRSSIDA